MSEDEYRAHFSLWAMMASPLMAGNDLARMQHHPPDRGAVLLEQNDEYQLQCNYVQLEGMTVLAPPQIEEIARLRITPEAA